MIDPKWLDALRLPLKVAIAVALAAGVLLYFAVKGWLDLGSLGAFDRPVLIILTVIFATLSVVGIADYGFAPMRKRRHVAALTARRALRKQEVDEKAQERRAAILTRLDHRSEAVMGIHHTDYNFVRASIRARRDGVLAKEADFLSGHCRQRKAGSDE